MIPSIDSELLYFIKIPYTNREPASQKCVIQYGTCYVSFELNVLMGKSRLRDIE